MAGRHVDNTQTAVAQPDGAIDENVLIVGATMRDHVAHASEDTVKQATKVATKPLLLSHTALLGSRAMGPTLLKGRQISRDHARAIAESGDRQCCPMEPKLSWPP